MQSFQKISPMPISWYLIDLHRIQILVEWPFCPHFLRLDYSTLLSSKSFRNFQLDSRDTEIYRKFFYATFVYLWQPHHHEKSTFIWSNFWAVTNWTIRQLIFCWKFNILYFYLTVVPYHHDMEISKVLVQYISISRYLISVFWLVSSIL